MAICISCGKEFKISGLKKLFNNQKLCQSCKDEKDKKIQRYSDAVKHFGKDNYLSKDEELAIQELKQNLGLTDEDLKNCNKYIEKLQTSSKKIDIAACEQKIGAVCSDGFISKDEELELAQMMTSLGISEEDIPIKSRQAFLDTRMLTQLAQGIFPDLKVDILLKKNEICHFVTSAQLMEEKTKTRYVGGSQGVSFRVAKGVTFRSGSFRGRAIKETNKEVTDTGILYVTNKRVLFVGNKKNVSYPINKILDICKYTDGIKFQKENESNLISLLIRHIN
jgi:hypothetical protein